MVVRVGLHRPPAKHVQCLRLGIDLHLVVVDELGPALLLRDHKWIVRWNEY